MTDPTPVIEYRRPGLRPKRRGLPAAAWFMAGFVGGTAAAFGFSLLVWRTRVFAGGTGAAVAVGIVVTWIVVAAAGVAVERTRPAGLGLLASVPVAAIIFVSVCASMIRL